MLRRTVILVAFVALACAAAPNAARTPTIAPGVIVGGVYLGGLSSEPARARLAADFDRPIPVVYGTQAVDGVARAARRRREHQHGRREGARRAPGSDVRPARSLVEQEGAAVRRRHREGHRPLGREREPRQRRKQRPGDHRLAGRHRGTPPAPADAARARAEPRPALADRRRRRGRCRRSRRARTSGRSSGSTAARTRCISTTARASCARSASRRDRRLPDAVGHVAHRHHAGEPVVDPAELGLGRRARSRFRPVRATRSARAGWASTPRASASTARPTRRRSATRPRTAASGCGSRTRSGCSPRSPSARRSTSPRPRAPTPERRLHPQQHEPTTAAVPTTITGASASTCSVESSNSHGDAESREHAERPGEPEESAAHRHDYPFAG